MRWLLALLACVPIAACITTATYVAAPPPPCFDTPTKLEIAELCTGQWDKGGRCESFGAWMQDYVRWRTGVFGKKLCRTEDAED